MTAKDLLYKILDYNYLWNTPYRINSNPAKVRLFQIEQLLDVFGLSKKFVNPSVQITYSNGDCNKEIERSKHLSKLTNLQYFMQGEFLFDREADANNELKEIALNKVKEIFHHLPERFFERRVDIGWMFNNLMGFRQEIYKVIYPDGGMSEGFSIGLHYSKYLQHQLKDVIRKHLSEIDNTLWLIMDPEKRDFRNEDIGFNEINLKRIDLNWEMEDY
jgi:hypothetical protein